MKTLSLCAALAALSLPVAAQKMATPAGEAPGPWLLGTIGVGKTADPKVPQTTALKGLAIKIGEHGEAAVAYDLDLCRMVGVWTGGKFATPMNLMSRGEYPTALGEVAFFTAEVPGFLVPAADARGAASTAAPKGNILEPAVTDGAKNATGDAKKATDNAKKLTPDAKKLTDNAKKPAPDAKNPDGSAKIATATAENSTPPATPGPDLSASSTGAGKKPATSDWSDPRPEPFGPLPPGQARFKGFYVNGGKTILKWDIGGTEVLEMPGYETGEGVAFFTRTFKIGPTSAPLLIPMWKTASADDDTHGASLVTASTYNTGDGVLAIVAEGQPRGTALWVIGGQKVVSLPASDIPMLFRVIAWRQNRPDSGDKAVHQEAAKLLRFFPEGAIPDPDQFIQGGPARWPESVTTAGEVSAKADEAYVVDTIKLPDPNPWGAPMFVGGFDFFPDGRAAVCTFHGDVFVVSGLSDSLEKVTWRRFAGGLYHALGLKIVNGEIYVTCRDGLWRLKDLNKDGECDFYEAFNFDLKVTKSFHEFVFDLQTDPAGNFYFAKAGPVKNGGRGFDEIMAHHGTLLRVSPDGAKLDVVATGFRAPNGIGVGPRFELTSGDNEGTWTPACKINWIKPGGFCGVVDLAHRPTPPTDYDRPLCWLPKRVDNSGGSQVWVPEGGKWGPWSGQLLHLSYGTCSVFGVMKERVVQRPSFPQSPDVSLRPPNWPAEAARPKGLMQGGVTRFPVNFQSGIMRARFNPTDGQLYVAGLRGWQTTGVKNGAFQRVRYTGAPVRMPLELHATKKGVRLTFTCQLDPATATDPQNWNVEVWNYLWSAAYGSPEFSTIEPVEKPADAGRQGEAQFSKTQIAQKKHDPLVVKSVTLSKDEKSVFLEIPEIKPVMQMAIKFGLKAADGAELRSEVINTIHALGD